MSRTPTSKANAIKPLTLQQVFDKVSVALLKQNKRSGIMSDLRCKKEFRCKYRGDNGLKCAIGHLIPNAAYTTSMEDASPESVLSLAKVTLTEECYSEALGPSSPLPDLQMVHDDNKPSKWPAKLRAYAKQYRLTHDKMDSYLKKVGR